MISILWLSLAGAQTPGAPMLLGADDDAEIVWIASLEQAAKSKRFAADKEATGPVFAPASTVRVLIRENGMVRVRSGDDYGWLPESAVANADPKPKTEFPKLDFAIPGAGGN